jgi:endonuclease YncB( thermonuclease family)
MNEDEQCFPDKPCPTGFEKRDEDETGRCYSIESIPPPPDGDCHPSYPDDCIPSPPPDLDCGDNRVPNNLKVLQPDPHRLDDDKDGVGCENGSSVGTGNSNNVGDSDNSVDSTTINECQGQADCFRGTVTKIVDGDTIDINNMRVRLALVNTPERGESGYTEAIDFVESVCGMGTTALVDEDDRQKEGSYDRLIGLVYCGDDGINNKKSLNELLLNDGYAVIYQDFCNISESSSASWAQRHEC